MFELKIDKDSRVFWDGAKENKLMIKRSQISKKCFLYSLAHTGISASEDYEWIEASGKGTIYSFTISHIPGGSKYYIDKTPYIIASILLEEGVRLTSNIISKDFKENSGVPIKTIFNDIEFFKLLLF